MRVILSVAMLLLSVLPLRAQVAEAPCTYVTCALRVESSFFGTRVVRGADGDRVATIGMFGSRPRLSEIVMDSERAVPHARIYERNTPRGALLLLSGLALTAVPALWEDSSSDGLQVASLVAGAGLTLWGSITLADAQRALTRSIWWYNAEFAR